MHKLNGLAFFAFLFFILLFFVANVRAVNSGVVISQVQAGNSSMSRLIELYNNTNKSVDVTGWCLVYKPPSVASKYNKIGCFREDKIVSERLFIKPYSYALITTNDFILGYIPDIIMGSGTGLGDSVKGSLYLMDSYTSQSSVGNIIDMVGWGPTGDIHNFETTAKELPDSKVIRRKFDDETKTYIDTNNNSTDFIDSELRDVSVYKNRIGVFEAVDSCLNIDGIQDVVGEGYEVDGVGNCKLSIKDLCLDIPGNQTLTSNDFWTDENDVCHPDACPNLDNVQAVIPFGYIKNDLGFCVIDACLNIDGAQSVVPSGYFVDKWGECKLDVLPLKINEILPNPEGADIGNEFIELYNPNDKNVDLASYSLYVGVDLDRSYGFPEGATISAGQYLAFKNNQIKFTLVNTTSSVALKTIDDIVIDVAPQYTNPKDGMSWSLIGGVWQYTNQPTFGAANRASIIDSTVGLDVDEGLAPCAANQYRNPLTNRCKLLPEYEVQLAPCKDGQYRSEETNRCRNIISDVVDLVPCAEGQERNPATNRCRLIAKVATALVPCKAGQYRSEETNRCRNIISDVAHLVPCAEGQERNPATNRCRAIPSVLGDKALAPCKEGQERNPETNRCRNIVSMTKADYAPEKTESMSDNSNLVWIFACVSLAAVGYGLWEWKYEIKKIYKKLKGAFNIKNRL